jgi:phosphoglycolate phosphatase
MSKPLDDFTIAFDLDGTLIDTAPDLVRATNEVMDRLRLSHVRLDDMRRIVGRGARFSMKRAAKISGYDISEAELDEQVPFFLDTYKAGIALRSRVYEGVESCLTILNDAGAKLVVCTNKPTHLSELVMGELGILNKFLGIYGPESTKKTKPDPIHLLTAIDGVGGKREKAILIGDSENDVLAAQAAKIPVVVTSFGYTEINAPDLGANAFFDHYDELFDIIMKLTNNQTDR